MKIEQQYGKYAGDPTRCLEHRHLENLMARWTPDNLLSRANARIGDGVTAISTVDRKTIPLLFNQQRCRRHKRSGSSKGVSFAHGRIPRNCLSEIPTQHFPMTSLAHFCGPGFNKKRHDLYEDRAGQADISNRHFYCAH